MSLYRWSAELARPESPPNVTSSWRSAELARPPAPPAEQARRSVKGARRAEEIRAGRYLCFARLVALREWTEVSARSRSKPSGTLNYRPLRHSPSPVGARLLAGDGFSPAAFAFCSA